MSDKISEIRERHSRDDRWRNTLPQMHDDRAILLAEVDRLTRERDEARAKVERLRLADDLARTALGGWVFVPPDGGAEPTHERIAAVVAEVERLRSQVVTLEAAADNTAKVIDKLWRERDRAQAKVERARVTLREIMLISRGVCGEIESGRDSYPMGDKP